MRNKSALVLYLPVLHEGYLEFFKKFAGGGGLFIFGSRLAAELMPYTKEIRAIDPRVMAKIVENLGWFKKVTVLEKKNLLLLAGVKVISADEEISRKFFAKYLRGVKVSYKRVFLRWDEAKVRSANLPKVDLISKDAFDRKMIRRAGSEAEKSSDWWRHVGAVVVKKGKIILEAHNHHLPSEMTPYVDGDPRDFVEAGKFGDLSTAIHAEQAIVSEAARKGISLAGADIYMNVFPCLICAKLIINAGIKRCFFVTGNAYLNVEEAFRVGGVKIIRVRL